MSTIAKLSLNFSLFLYLISYLPQLHHNQKNNKLDHLSEHFHFLFFTSALFDIFYAYGLHMPWQYKVVSYASLITYAIQNWQINRFKYTAINIMIIVVILLAITGEMLNSSFYFLLFGYCSQTFGLISALPQIFKNYFYKTATALCYQYLTLNLTCNLCDNISAWLLHWPLPSKIDAAVSLFLYLVLLQQNLSLKRK